MTHKYPEIAYAKHLGANVYKVDPSVLEKVLVRIAIEGYKVIQILCSVRTGNDFSNISQKCEKFIIVIDKQ